MARPGGSITCQIDTQGFTAYLNDLAKISGASFEQVLVAEAAAVIRSCVRDTKVASTANIQAKYSKILAYAKFDDGTTIAEFRKGSGDTMFLDDSTYTGGGKAPKLFNGKAWHRMDGPHRFSNQRWAKFTAHKAEIKNNADKKLRALKKARGLAKNRWLQCARDLGVEDLVGGQAFAKTAIGHKGVDYKEGKAAKFINGATAYIDILNSSYLVMRNNGAFILKKAVDSRMSAFKTNMQKGVFNDIKARSARYKGIDFK